MAADGNNLILFEQALLSAPVSGKLIGKVRGAGRTAKKEIADAVEEVMKNGRKAIKGKCPTCGTVMFKILGGKATPPAPPAAPPA